MKKAFYQKRAIKLLSCFVFLLASILSLSVSAQCPVTNSCTPGNAPSANLVFGMGILNVTIGNGAINNTTQGAAQGYQNYSCTIGASLLAGAPHPVSIQTNANVNENVRVWIDYNNDGTFNATTELAFNSLNSSLHTGNITLPGSAVTNQPLRMRVSADNFSSPLPTPCSTPVYSQVEDYRITILPNTNPPAAAFSASATTTCSPAVSFTDQSQNGPTSWLWNFGDPASGANNTSTLQNPSHSFSAPGTYTVSLIVCRGTLCDTLVKANYITYHTNAPIAASCTPATANFCCGYGITSVNFGNGLMINASADGSAGYEDFSCTKSVSVMIGNKYPFSLTTGANPQDTRIYIDLDNDGSFTGTYEMVMQLLNKVNPSDTLLIPGTTVTNTPLRMRIVSDAIGNNFTSCTGIQNGQAEDYTIIIAPNTNPPVAQFTSNPTTACDTIVQFIDQSYGAPTSWLWNFGDPGSGINNTSTLRNPTHIYHNAGWYTVTLKVTNANGVDSLIKTNYKVVMKPCLTYCSSSGNNASQWISKVQLGAINNPSGADPNGYKNFTYLKTDLVAGTTNNQLSVTVGRVVSNNCYVFAWIDFDQDGTFSSAEKVVNAASANGNPYIATALITVPGSALPGTTRMRVVTSSNSSLSSACTASLSQGEVEDYTVNITSNPLKPVANFSANLSNVCITTKQFTDLSLNGPTSWLWNFGDPASGANNTSTLQNPTHTYPNANGNYTVTLIVCKATQCDTLVKTNYVIIAAPCPTYCIPSGYSVGQWISKVEIGTINNSSGPNANGYGDYTSQVSNINLNSTSVPVKVNLGSNSSNTNGHVAIWIDFNRDGTFTWNESVLSTTAPWNNNYLATGNITIPANVTPGPTRMRIIGNQNPGNANACAVNMFPGEAEDYTLNFVQNSQPVVAAFFANMGTVCSGNIAFSDRSSNGPTSWLWNFGHPASGANNTSTLQNPSHTYPSGTAGSYTITLIACKAGVCDTIVQPNSININVPCLTYCTSYGISNAGSYIGRVQMGSIDNISGFTTLPSSNRYSNFTYLNTVVTPGTAAIPITVTGNAATAFGNTVNAWIDFNHDGTFSASEKVMNEPMLGNGIPKATGLIPIPNNASIGAARMRLIMGGNGTNPCQTNISETEDYTIIIQPNQVPPLVDFSGTPTLTCDGVVNFTDLSTNNPTSWQWNFGDPASGASNTSTLQNPVHTFSAPGTYTITLTSCNAYGCSPAPLVKTAYITYDSTNVACFAVNMPVSGTVTKTSCSGKVYDNGGPSGNYTGNVNSTLVIAPTGASTVALTFNSFAVESGFDYVRVYDGPNTTSPSLGVFTGSVLPNNGLPIVSSGGAITLKFTSDNFNHGLGFDASWSCVTGINGADLAGKAFEIYPNPTQGKLQIRIPEALAGTYKIELTDLTGKVLMTGNKRITGSDDNTLDISFLPKGVYLLKLQNSASTVIKKICKE